MRHELIALVLLVALADIGRADAQGDLPVPGGYDVPDTHYKGGGDNVPYIPKKPSLRVKTPIITGVRMVNGYLRFTFGGGGPNTMRYNIRWSRPGKTEVTDMRWTRPWQSAWEGEIEHSAQAEEERYKRQATLNLEEYVINELAVPDSVYTFKVQAEGKTKVRDADGVYRYPLSTFVEKSFRTRPGPSASEKIKSRDNPFESGGTVVEAQGRVKVPAVDSAPPVPICDAARAASARNSPAAPGLEARCRALVTQVDGGAPGNDEEAARGEIIAAGDPWFAALRDQQPTPLMRRGFHIEMAVAEGQTAWGPGKQELLDSLSPAEQEGFKAAASISLDRNRNAELARIGAAIAAADPIVAQARTGSSDARYWLGFDIASGLFGDPALGAKGNTATGPGSLSIRDALSATAETGFDASTRLHLSRRY